MQKAHDAKIRSWLQHRGASREVFIPLALEMWGGWHPEAITTLTKLATRMAHASMSDVGVTRSRFLQQLSVSLYKGVANAMESRICCSMADDDFAGAPFLDASHAHSLHSGPTPCRASVVQTAINQHLSQPMDQKTSNKKIATSSSLSRPSPPMPLAQIHSNTDACCYCGKESHAGVIRDADTSNHWICAGCTQRIHPKPRFL